MNILLDASRFHDYSEAATSEVMTHSVHDFETGEIICADVTGKGLHPDAAVGIRQVMETDAAASIAAAALPDVDIVEDRLYVAGSHAVEGVVALGIHGRVLHILQIVDKERSSCRT